MHPHSSGKPLGLKPPSDTAHEGSDLNTRSKNITNRLAGFKRWRHSGQSTSSTVSRPLKNLKESWMPTNEANVYGRPVQSGLIVETYRGSVFADRRKFTLDNKPIARTASFKFPRMTPPREWVGVVGGDGIAEWSIPWTEVQQVPDGEFAELWVNGAAYKKGTVQRSGDLT